VPKVSDTLSLPDSRAALDRCLELGEKFNDLRAIPAERRSDTYEADRRRCRDDLLDANAEFDMAVRMERYAMEMAAWDHALQNPQPEARGPQAAFADLGIETRSAGQIVVASEAYAARTPQGFAEIEVRNLLTGTSLGTSGSHNLAPLGQPRLAGVRQMRLFVRDLLSVQQTTLASVPYVRELNAATNETGASAVQEASAKPEVTAEFERDDAPIRKIAAWIQATDEALADAPTLAGYIDNRLGYMVMLREEQQILNGSGTAPQIKGIRQYSGVQTATGLLYDVVGTAIGKIENVDGDADGVAVNPIDFWAAVTDRHSETYDGAAFGTSSGNAPFGSPQTTIWGLPAVRTRSMESGKALVGSWQLGATMHLREGVTIRSTDSHASLFVSNTVVILAEERVGLEVDRADFFCLCTVTAPS
jgi:hypothetical protein